MHGGDLDGARARYPQFKGVWIDLSTGINPVAYPLPVLPSDIWMRLPGPSEMAALMCAARLAYGVPARAGVVAAPGTQALIQLLPRLLPAARVAVLGPTYEEHAVCWRRHGAEVVMASSLDAALAIGADTVVVVNPNNPDGRIIAPAVLHATAARMAERGRLLVVDEAFNDVLPVGSSIVPELPEGCLVLRSFGKAYGLAGLRLGFAIGPQALIARLRTELGPWAVSGPALSTGASALGDTAWIAAARDRLTRDAARLDRLIQRAGGIAVGGTPLFRLASFEDGVRVVSRLGAAGIHVRAFAANPTWVRFGLPGDQSHWQRLADALGVPNADLD